MACFTYNNEDVMIRRFGGTMKRQRLLVLVCLILTASLVGQVEHAPTVAQCQADQRLWFSEIEGESSTLPKYDVLSEWAIEMGECKTVDPANFDKYYNLHGEIDAERALRMMHFIERHGLWTQFKAEDAAGKR
jgi:hypothetical protein